MPKRITNKFKSHLTPDSFIHGMADIPLSEIHQMLEDTAREIDTATTSTQQWPAFILFLLEALEAHTTPNDDYDERLVVICEKITRRLNQGRW